MGEKRMPSHKSSIEKRNRIIKKGFELMCNNGYFKTNTVDIAKYAGVSTGIIYQYFDDKRDIFIEGVKEYSHNIINPTFDLLDKYKGSNDIDGAIRAIVDKFVEQHTISKRAHEELMAMSYLDDEVGKIIRGYEISASEKIVNYLKLNDVQLTNIHEKVHIIIGIINNYCHEVVYHRHEELNYSNMEDEVIKTIRFILDNKR